MGSAAAVSNLPPQYGESDTKMNGRKTFSINPDEEITCTLASDGTILEANSLFLLFFGLDVNTLGGIKATLFLPDETVNDILDQPGAGKLRQEITSFQDPDLGKSWLVWTIQSAQSNKHESDA